MPSAGAGAGRFRRSTGPRTARPTIRSRGCDAMKRTDPYAGFRFVVEIDGLLQGGFSKVRGLNRETRVESFREGGVNDFERKLVTLTTYPALVLERGLADPQLWEWHQRVIEGRVTRRVITINLRDERGSDI